MMDALPATHNHVFLGEGHEQNERRTWMVIALCTVMMIAEIVGGFAFGSIALIADGLHMSTHASALLLAALAYSYARRHADDEQFSFGTGKLGDLAGFTSAIVLAMIALLIGYEAAHALHLACSRSVSTKRSRSPCSAWWSMSPVFFSSAAAIIMIITAIPMAAMKPANMPVMSTTTKRLIICKPARAR